MPRIAKKNAASSKRAAQAKAGKPPAKEKLVPLLIMVPESTRETITRLKEPMGVKNQADVVIKLAKLASAIETSLRD